jgi:hypothetical protein
MRGIDFKRVTTATVIGFNIGFFVCGYYTFMLCINVKEIFCCECGGDGNDCGLEMLR